MGYTQQLAQEEARRCLRCDLEWLDFMKLSRPQSLCPPGKAPCLLREGSPTSKPQEEVKVQ